MKRITITAVLCALCCAPAAFAHITLEQPSAAAGSNYKAVFRVPHGCDGAATTALTVFLPDGFVGAKPMPKPGWTLDIQTEKLAQPYDSHGAPITERAARISWRGGLLRDAEYDEFIISLTLPQQAGRQWIRVLQQCEKGQTDWAAIPLEGQPMPRFPAPALDILPADPHAGHHH